MADQIVGSQRLDNYELQSQQIVKALGGVPNNRAYALDATSLRGGVSVLRALQDLSGRENIGVVDVEALLTRIVKTVPDSWPYDDRSVGLVQRWKVEATTPMEKIPEVWLDPVLKTPLANPFDPERPDREGQGILIARDAALAAHYKALATGSGYGIVAALQDEKARKATLAKLDYNAREHSSSPYRLDQWDPEAQAVFNKTQGALVAGVWKEEARQKVRLPWSSDSAYLNRTINGALMADFDRVPFLGCDGDLFRRAAGADAALVSALRARASAAAAEAQRVANELSRTTRR